jgi:putative ABC transport system permease protein
MRYLPVLIEVYFFGRFPCNFSAPPEYSLNPSPYHMLKNYFSIAIRNIRQNPLYAVINIFSLAIGLAACLVIFLFIADESSFDAFHLKKDNIYRLDEVQSFTGTNVQKVALSMGGMGPTLAAEFPEVKSFTRFWNHGKQLLEKDDAKFLINNVAMVDSTFLQIFDFPLLQGEKGSALNEPYSIVISERTANKFFKNKAEALGQTLVLQNDNYKITGVLKDVPENSHLQFEVLISINTITRKDPEFNNRWGGNFLNTYLVLTPEVNIQAMEEKFPAYLSRHIDDPDINKYYVLFLQKLEDVHLASMDIEHDYNNYRKFNGEYLDVFSIIGLFILLIAGVNFMNLTTARASHRWKEIGVRKTVGARKLQLFSQFIFESTLLALVALVLAVLLDLLTLPLLNELIGRKLSMLTLTEHPVNIFLAVIVTLALGVLTGLYPAFYMTSFNMARVLKGKSDGKSVFRSSLVVVQFGLALAMIVSTLVVIQQLGYMKGKDIGFDKEQMVLISMNQEANEKFVTLKTEMAKSRFVEGVTASGQRLGNNFHQWGFKVKADTGVLRMTPSNVHVDYDYLNVYGIKIKEGRGFSKDRLTDNGLAFVINESLAKELKLKEPIGTPVGHGHYPDDSLGTIIGVVEDFNFNSLHYKINTLAMVVHPDWGYEEMSVKINASNTAEAIAEIKRIWESQVSSFPFTYTFLDEHFSLLYRSDQQMSAVVTVMAVLAILISCMGLFGLAAITTSRKTKEIGIRKALGATEGQITFLLSKNFTALIILSFVLVSPITYWLLAKWLDGFAYRIDIDPLVFLLGGLVSIFIAVGTISYHTIRSARANPVKALRYE